MAVRYRVLTIGACGVGVLLVAAIALTPILAARWRTRDLDAIRAAAPGARLVTIGFDGHPDGPLAGACERSAELAIT